MSASVWHPFTQMKGFEARGRVVRAQGAWLEFEGGHRAIDGISSWWVNTHGHAHPKIAEAIAHPDSVLSDAEVSRLLFQAFSDDFAYNPNNSLLQELLSAGRLEILSNAELRNKLTGWNSRIERIRQQETSLREQRYRVLDVARSGTGSIRRIFEENGLAEGLLGMTPSPDPGTNLPLLESRQFENNVLIFILTAVYTEQMHYQPLLEEIQKILSLIDQDRE